MSRLHRVDPTTIEATSNFIVLEKKLTDCKTGRVPCSVKCLKKNRIWNIGDFVTNGTKMKGRISGFDFFIAEDTSEILCFVSHNWSKVGMALEELEHVSDQLPTQFQIREVVDFVINETRHTATVTGVFINDSRIKYDLDLWIEKEGGNSSTRIHGVDAELVQVYISKKSPYESNFENVKANS